MGPKSAATSGSTLTVGPAAGAARPITPRPATAAAAPPAADIPALSNPNATHCRVVARVRPMFETEKTVIADGYPVPRGILEIAGSSPATINVLDVALKYKPKKGASYVLDGVVNDFVEPTSSAEEIKQFQKTACKNSEALYRWIGKDMIKNISDGYHCGVVFCGVGKVGKTFSLFGAKTSGVDPMSLSMSQSTSMGNPVKSKGAAAPGGTPPMVSPRAGAGDDSDNDKGFLSRFSEDLFAMIAAKPENSKVTVDMEFIEVLEPVGAGSATAAAAAAAMAASGGTGLFDLLVKKASSRVVAPGAHIDPNTILKIREDADGAISVTNLSKQQVEDAESMMAQVKLSLKAARKQKTSHLVLILTLHETVTFTDPKQQNNTVTKTHHVRCVIGLISGAPTVFFRCLDTAGKREAGELQLKVPARESTLTKLLTAEFFGGNCRSNVVLCLSPFLEHVKDCVATLSAGSRMVGVKHNSKIVVETQTLEFRRLEGEMKGLEDQLKETHHSRQVVQDELNNRQQQLEKLMERYEEQYQGLQCAEEELELEKTAVKVQKVRLRHQDARFETAMKALEEEIDAVKKTIEGLKAQEAKLTAEGDDHAAQIAAVQDKMKADVVERETIESDIHVREKHHAEMLEFRKSLADPTEARVTMKRDHEATMESLRQQQQQEVEVRQPEIKAAVEVIEQKKVETKEQTAAIEVKKKESKKVADDLEGKRKEEAAMKQEIEKLELEIKELEDELAKPDPPAGCCVVS